MAGRPKRRAKLAALAKKAGKAASGAWGAFGKWRAKRAAKKSAKVAPQVRYVGGVRKVADAHDRAGTWYVAGYEVEGFRDPHLKMQGGPYASRDAAERAADKQIDLWDRITITATKPPGWR